MATCDKCGENVHPSNDASLLEYIVRTGYLPGGMSILFFGARPRHLFATPRCEGSPSRRALIETNERWREAYELFRAEFGETT